MSPRIPDDLSWLALQYICDELSPTNRDAFELMLAEDQTAREAVAEAVECCSAVRIAYGEHAAPLAPAVSPAMPATSPRLRQRSAWRRSLSAATWMVSGAAACLLAILALQNEPPAEFQPRPSAAETAQGVALAQAYVAGEHVDVLQAWAGPIEEGPTEGGGADAADGSYSLEAGYASAEPSAPADSAFEVRENAQPGEGGSRWAMESLHSAGDDWMLALVALDGESGASTVEQDN